MPTPSFGYTRSTEVNPIGGYAFDVTYNSDVNTPALFVAGKITLTLTGFQEDFVPQGIRIEPRSKAIGGSGPGACYATYDEASVVKYNDTTSGHDPTQLVADFYVSSNVSTLHIVVY